MCNEPVTLGGGMTIENGGWSLCASARKYPAATHRSYRRCSTSAGWYWAGRLSAPRLEGVSVTVRVYGAPRETGALTGLRGGRGQNVRAMLG